MSLANQFHPTPKPSFGRSKPKRGHHTKFKPKTRQAIIARDNGLCVRCGKPYHNIHHITFASQGGEGAVENGVCVCGDCHGWAHSGKQGRRWFERYREKHLIVQLINIMRSDKT